MSLVELILAIVIISVGLAGVLTVYSTTVRQSADPMIRKQMISIAEEMIAEITSQSYEALANGVPAPCARDLYNDSIDYNGYNSGTCQAGGAKIYSRAGSAVAGLNGYRVVVAVVGETWNSTPAQKVTVTVSSPQNESLALVTWRTEWSK